jgi:hypothetical protein
MNIQKRMVMGLSVVGAVSLLGCSSNSANGAASSSSTGKGDGGSQSDGGSAASKNGADGCPVKSGFAGDERCLAAPTGTDRMQVHFGPKNYDDPDEVALYTVQPGDEIDKCFFVKLPNQTDFIYGKRHGSMRPGSHHFIARAMSGIDVPDGFADCNGADGIGNADDIGTFQVPDYTYPPDAPDYEGLSGTIAGGRQGMLNGHFINQTDAPTLAEAWIDYEAIDPAKVKGQMMPISLTGGLGMRIAPHTQQTLHFSCSPNQDVRILELESHMHAHGVRMSAWKVDAAGQKTLIYEGFDWREPARFNFDSVTQNPVSDDTTKKAGAFTGPLTVGAKETVEWECEINNTSDGILKFRNEVNTGEMCILGGMTTAVTGDTQPFGCNRN